MSDFITKMIVYLYQRKRRLAYLLCLFLVYGMVKSIAYFSPLLLNSVLNDVHNFGEFEYSLNLGQTFSTVIALGLPSAYSYFIFKEKEEYLNVIFHNIYFVILIFLIAVGFCLPGMFSNLYFTSILIGVALSNQLFVTTYYKLKGFNFLAIIVDCGVYILLGAYALLIFEKKIQYNFSIWSYIILSYTFLIVLCFHFRKIGAFMTIKKSDWWRVLRYGILIVFTLFLTSLLTTSTRIFIEYFNDFSSVGRYSLFIRISSAIIIFHRVMVILLYRKIYGDKHKKLDNYFAIMIFLALVGGFLVYIGAPLAAPHIIPTFENAKLHSGNMFTWTILQAISWTPVAVLELIVYRENILSHYIPWLILILVFMGILFFSYEHFFPISTEQILKINVLSVLAVAYCQIKIIKDNAYFYKKTLLAHLVLTVICLLAIIF